MRTYPTLIILFLLTWTLHGAASAADQTNGDAATPLKVFVLAGQSNMVGKRSKVDELPESLRGPQSNLFFSAKRQWIALEPGKTEKQGFGPEITFALEMSKALGEQVGIIKVSVGGTDLATRWNPKNKNSLYTQLKQQVAAARRSRPIEIAGMFWVQGGADAKDKAKADAYAANLIGLIKASRDDFGNPVMPFVCERIRMRVEARKPYLAIVRQAYETCKAHHYQWIDGDHIERGADNIHYTTKGYGQLGTAGAKAMVKLIRHKASTSLE